MDRDASCGLSGFYLSNSSRLLASSTRSLRSSSSDADSVASFSAAQLGRAPKRFSVCRRGRLKFNIKLFENQEATSLDKRTLDPDDFYATIAYLLKLRKSIGA